MKITPFHFSIFLFLILSSCMGGSKKEDADSGAPDVNIREESVTYSVDSVTMKGFIAYNDADSSKRPVVLIVHEWWGLNDYARERMRQLARLGYVAMAVDLYGNGITAANPAEAKSLAGPFYQNPRMAKQRFGAALEKVKECPVADPDRIAAIGYCFGGSVVLNVARLGEELDGVVSFHGSLLGVPADKNLLKAEVLVCHGDSDRMVSLEEVQQFSNQMDSIGAAFTVKHYAGATHAFTNPGATERGKEFSLPIAYNAAADSASFGEMLAFFGRIFR